MTTDTTRIVDHETRRKANAYFFSKVAFNVFLMFLGAVLIAVFLRQMQTKTAFVKQQENSQLALNEAIDLLQDNARSAEELTQIFHKGNQDVLEDLVRLFDSGVFKSLAQTDSDTRSQVFGDLVSRSGVDYLFLMNMDSKIVLAPQETLYNVNPAAMALMTQENINRILEGSMKEDGAIQPVLVRNQYGAYYFYSVPYRYGGGGLCLRPGCGLLRAGCADLVADRRFRGAQPGCCGQRRLPLRRGQGGQDIPLL